MFQNLDVFQAANAMAQHAGKRQTLVARNMANADTPGYQAHDATPFKELLNTTPFSRSSRNHSISKNRLLSTFGTRPVESNATSPNGNSVSIEQEMLRAVDVKRQHDRALAIYRHSLTVLRASLGRQ